MENSPIQIFRREKMRNLRTYDMLTIQEKRQITPWASEFLAKQEYARKRHKQIVLAQKQEENNYEPEIET